MRLGLGSYTWQASSDDRLGRVEHIASVVAGGSCQGIEPEMCVLGDYLDAPGKLKELLDLRGLRLAAICYVEDWLRRGESDDEAARATRVIEHLSQSPGSLLQLCPRSGRDRANLRERQENAIRCMNDIARRASDRGITCAVHPSSPLGSVFRIHDDYEILLNGLDTAIVGFVPDTGNIARGGMDPLDTIRAYRPLVRHVHLKDLSASGEWAQMGKGIVDVTAVLGYLADTKYEEWVIVEDESPFARLDPDEAARRDAAYVRDLLLALTR